MQLPGDFFECDSVVGLQEACRQEEMDGEEEKTKNSEQSHQEAGGVTVEVDLQQVALHLLLLLQVPQHTLQQLQSTNTTPSLIAVSLP